MRKILLLIMLTVSAYFANAQTGRDIRNITIARDVIALNFEEEDAPDNYVICIAWQDMMLAFERDNKYIVRYYRTRYDQSTESASFNLILEETEPKNTGEKKKRRCGRNRKRSDWSFDKIFSEEVYWKKESIFVPESVYSVPHLRPLGHPYYTLIYRNGEKVHESNLHVSFGSAYEGDYSEFLQPAHDAFGYLFMGKMWTVFNK